MDLLCLSLINPLQRLVMKSRSLPALNISAEMQIWLAWPHKPNVCEKILLNRELSEKIGITLLFFR